MSSVDRRAAEARSVMADKLVAHAVTTKRPADVRWMCFAGQSGGRGGCLLLRAWRVIDADDTAVVALPAVRRGGNSMYLTHNDRDPDESLWLSEFRTYWGTEDGEPLPALLRCNHYNLHVRTADLLDDLTAATRQRRSVRRFYGADGGVPATL